MIRDTPICGGVPLLPTYRVAEGSQAKARYAVRCVLPSISGSAVINLVLSENNTVKFKQELLIAYHHSSEIKCAF